MSKTMFDDYTDKLIIEIVTFSGSKVPSRQECRAEVENMLKRYTVNAEIPKLSMNEFGKPMLKTIPALSINYSHSKTQLVVASHVDVGNIGIDTEPKSRVKEIASLRITAFSELERTDLKERDYVMRWCLKEAAVKRMGKGFRDNDPATFTVITDKDKYTLYLDGKVLETGYFTVIAINDEILVCCVEKPFNDCLLVHRQWDYSHRERNS